MSAVAQASDAEILIVDDEVANVKLLERMLRRAAYEHVRITTNAADVVPLCRERAPDILLLDLHMPDMNGLAVLEAVKSLALPLEPFVIVLTGDSAPDTRTRALANGARDFVAKPFDQSEVLLRIRNLIDLRLMQRRLHQQNRELEARVRLRTADLEAARQDVLERLAMASEFRDDATGQHTRRVGELAAATARELGLSENQVEMIRRAAPLHDVGKIAIPDSILLKRARLTDEEFEIMKTHTTVGARLLSNGITELLDVACTIALNHHEHWDGRGYPGGLQGEAIPVPARIVAVADFFDAMTHDRPYRQAHGVQQVRELIRNDSGRHFDPEVAGAFLAMLG